MRAIIAIPTLDEYPWKAVKAGLNATGYETMFTGRASLEEIDASDLLVTWSPWEGSMRSVLTDRARVRGKPVIVMENGWFPLVPGYQVALDGWNGTGRFPAGDSSRWVALERKVGVMRPWGADAWHPDRPAAALVIAQRGHPTDRRTAPPGWGRALDWKGRSGCVTFRGRDSDENLTFQVQSASEVHVWSSSVAAVALWLGVPVIQHGPNCMVQELTIKADRARQGGEEPLPLNRVEVFSRLAWAQWSADEIASGVPFKRLLEWKEN